MFLLMKTFVNRENTSNTTIFHSRHRLWIAFVRLNLCCTLYPEIIALNASGRLANYLDKTCCGDLHMSNYVQCYIVACVRTTKNKLVCHFVLFPMCYKWFFKFLRESAFRARRRCWMEINFVRINKTPFLISAFNPNPCYTGSQLSN